MKLRFLALTLLTLISNSAFAEGSFDGVNLQVGVGVASLTQSGNAKLTEPGYVSDLTISSVNSGQSGAMGTTSIGYSYGFSNKLNIAANVFYMFGNDQAGGYSLVNNELNVNRQTKNIWGIAVEPGYYLTDKTLGYVKVGWSQASSSVVLNGLIGTSQTWDIATTNGFLYGLGLKQMLNEYVWLGIEGYQINYASKTSTQSIGDFASMTVSSQPMITYGGVNLGIRF